MMRRAILAAAMLGHLGPAIAQDSIGRLVEEDSPIDISADALEVRQEDSLAIFTGNVQAIQGQLVLNADRVQVYYATDDSGTTDVGAIRQIDALGNVFVTSPEETAQGREGVYDLAGETITLIGDVVLTRGENVIRGERLVMDLVTGRSRIDAAPGATGTGRVRGVFVPGGDGGANSNTGQ